MDKKEVSVWKLSGNVSKPDFRHRLDSIDLQLVAIHSFSCPDLVLEKVNRLSTEVTSAALFQIIEEVDEEHRKNIAAAAATGGLATPPGMPGIDPWHVGLGKVQLYQELYEFTDRNGTLPRNPDGCTRTRLEHEIRNCIQRR